MQANFTGRRLWFAASSVIIHTRGLRLKNVYLPTLGGFDKGLWQSTAKTQNLEGEPKCKHFDSPSGATGGDNISQSTTSFILFKCGRYCPLNRSFRPAAPWYYSSAGALVPQIALSGQQRLHIIRVRASVPRIVFFVLATPSHYSNAGSGPSNCFFRASSALVLFECGLRFLESLLRASSALVLFKCGRSCPSNRSFGPAAPLRYSTAGFGHLNYSLRASSASTLFECGFQSLKSHLSAISAFILFGYGPLSFESLFCATNAFELPKIWWQYTNSDAVCQI
jgi:hypothetical protein